MDDITSFLPRRQTDVLAYGAQVHGVLSSPDFDPASLQLTDADVTELGALLTDAQSSMNAVSTARMELAARTKAWSARGGAHERLVTKLRTIANTARVSDAPHSVLANIGVRRKAPKPTRRNAPQEAPHSRWTVWCPASSTSGSAYRAAPSRAPAPSIPSASRSPS